MPCFSVKWVPTPSSWKSRAFIIGSTNCSTSEKRCHSQVPRAQRRVMTSFRRTQTSRRVMSMRFKPHFLALVSSSLLVIFIMSLISGCSPFYIMRAAYEEGKILWRREPITEFLAKPDVVPDAQEKLRLVLAVREYARD